jgi:hypothetical protein
MNKFLFTPLRAGIYQIFSNNELYANVNKHYFLAANGQKWHRGYDVVKRDGEVEHFKNLNAIHLKYKFANYPGYGKILRPL